VQSAVVAVIVVAVDQLSKLAVVRNVPILSRQSLIGDVVRLTHIRNPGAVFGLMKGAGTYFTFFSLVAASILIVVLYFAKRSSTMVKIALGLVLGGAVGNLIDRLRYGAVVDFIDIGVSDTLRWPCFNAADAAITVGVLLLLFNSLKVSRRIASE